MDRKEYSFHVGGHIVTVDTLQVIVTASGKFA